MAKTNWQPSDTVKAVDMNQIGQEINQLRTDIDNIDVPPASLTKPGIVQLSSATDSDSETMAATPKAVKAAFQYGIERKAEVVAALNSIGVPATVDESWDSLISKMAAVIRATGNAVPADLLSGRTASNINGPFTGTMPNRGAGGTVTPGTNNQTKSAGYYGSDITILGDSGLVSGNIKSGSSIFGVPGNFTSDATAQAGHILSGYSAYVNGAKVNGAMPKQPSGARPASPDAGYADGVGNLFSKVPPGYYYEDNVYISSYDPDFIANNFPKDVNIFGLVGALERMTTAEKQAIATAISNKGVAANVNDSNTVLAQKIGQIVTGKRFASGTAISGSTNQPFYVSGGGGVRMYPMSVDYNFGFVPSFVIVTLSNSNEPVAFYYSGILVPGTAYSAFNAYDPNNGYRRNFYTRSEPNGTDFIIYTVVNRTQLYLPMERSSYTYQWYAFE
ncbi:phage tail protein [Paenibacillus oralis]|uniref:phage tail protein n=1 Tax=Paenibacillus oralis TaxID=2490856 RepID=UPI001C49B07C|nr:phage tail protein [Paenibacillus oralis]